MAKTPTANDGARWERGCILAHLEKVVMPKAKETESTVLKDLANWIRTRKARYKPEKGGLKLFGCFLLLGVLAFASGCASMTPQQKMQAAATGAFEAARVGTVLCLQQNPQQLPLFNASIGALDGLIKDGSYDPVAFQKAIRLLPVGALHGDQGAVLVQTIVSIYTVALGYIDVNNADLKLVIVAVRDGLKSGVAQAAASPAKLGALKVTRPAQRCVLPAR